MELSRRAVLLLAAGGIGWLLAFIVLLGGCDKTVTQTVSITHTRTVVVTVSQGSTGATGATGPTGSTNPPTRETASLKVLTAHGKVDPVADVGRVFQFKLYSPAETYLYVKYRSAGGAPCAATDDSDSGESLVSDQTVAVGASHYRDAQTWSGTGRVLFCMWLGSSGDDPSSKVFSQTIKFRPPRGTIAFRATPAYGRVEHPTTLHFTGATEAPRELLVKYRSAGGAGCAPTAGSDSGSEIIYTDENGGFNETYVWTPSSPGAYLFCAWLATDSGDVTPVAARAFRLTVR
jgi:hypothetical protein